MKKFRVYCIIFNKYAYICEVVRVLPQQFMFFMKKSLALSLCAFAGAALVLSCEPVEGENVDVSGGSVTVSVSTISAPEEGLVERLVVEAPEGLEISTKVESTAKTWISVSPAEGNQFEITVARNEATKSRKAKVFFSAPACASATVVVSQAAAAHEKEFSVPATSVSATHYGGRLSFSVDAYPQPSIEIAEGSEWISGLTFADGVCSFDVAAWEGQDPGQVRTGIINVVPVNGETVSVSVTQSSSEFVRNSLVTKFTGTWCGYCPFMSFAIEEAMEKNSQIVPMYVYNDLGGDDSLFKVFGISGFPTGLVDFRGLFSNETQTSSMVACIEGLVQESSESYASVTGFEASVKVDGGSLKVDVSVLPIVSEPAMKLAVVVVENGIVKAQEFYGNASDYPEIDFNNYVHDHVVRVSPTGCTGESFPVEAGKVSSKSYSVELEQSWDASKLEAIIFTLRPFPASPVQAVSRAKYTDKAGAYVDNVVSVKAGKSVTYEFE